MGQAEKLAAVAARDLLKADANRQRRAAAAQTRKASSAGRKSTAPEQMRKSKGGAALRGSSSGTPTAPEQNIAGGFGPTSPSSFTDGRYFFNSPSNFFASTSQSPSQPWMVPQSSDPATWDKNPIPPGGFTNLVQPHVPQNFHFTGGPSHFVPFKPPRSMEDTPAEEEIATPPPSMNNDDYINVDSEDELPRTEKRIIWTQEEDVRMMSSWLLNSTDSSVGADRTNEQYWYDVVDTYNETTPSNRRRNVKQSKDRFHKVNRWTDLFHSAWVKARRIFTSGYNDEMWIEKAHAFYLEDNKDQKLGPFVLMNVWKVVRNEAKWITYNLKLKEARKRKSSGKEKETEDVDHIDVDELEGPPRPMGQKRAKKAAFEKNGKRKDSDVEELEKFGKIQSEEHANRLKVLEVQQKLSSEKMEQAKLAHLAAKEQKEAAEKQREARKFELEAKMFETYNRLLSLDKSLMSDEEKEDHANTMKCLKKKLFPDN
ncbi:unnamed protein product [Urochloa humidicola]